MDRRCSVRVTSACGAEVLTVRATPSFTTAQKLLPNDSATLSGGKSPTGTITFSLFAPVNGAASTCPASGETPAFTQGVTVTGNGTYTTTNTTVLAQTEGQWNWKVVYGGDANNDGFTLACGTEHFIIEN